MVGTAIRAEGLLDSHSPSFRASIMSVALTLSQAAEQLNCSVDLVRSLIRSKRLHAVNLATGKQRAKWVVPKAAIEKCLAPEAESNKRKSRKTTTTFKRY